MKMAYKCYKFVFFFRSRGSTGKGKDSEYENMESENGEDSEAEAGGAGQPLLPNRDSEQREIDEFEEEERRLLAEEAKVRLGN